jgi:hypothetical protein
MDCASGYLLRLNNFRSVHSRPAYLRPSGLVPSSTLLGIVYSFALNPLCLHPDRYTQKQLNVLDKHQ